MISPAAIVDAVPAVVRTVLRICAVGLRIRPVELGVLFALTRRVAGRIPNPAESLRAISGGGFVPPVPALARARDPFNDPPPPPPPPRNLTDNRDDGNGFWNGLAVAFVAALFIVPDNSAQAQTPATLWPADLYMLDGNDGRGTVGDNQRNTSGGLAEFYCIDAGHRISGRILYSVNGVFVEGMWCKITGGLTHNSQTRAGCLLKASGADFDVNHDNNNRSGRTEAADFRGGPKCTEVFPECATAAERLTDNAGNPNPFSGCGTREDECDARASECHAAASCSDPDHFTTNTAAELCACDNNAHTGDGTDGEGPAKGCNFDECSTRSGECHAAASCNDPHSQETNTADELCACGDGYNGNGVTCTDIDECAPNNGKGPCAAEATCANADTSGEPAVCACPSDKPNGDGLADGSGCLPATSATLSAPSGNGLWPAAVYALGVDGVGDNQPDTDGGLVEKYCVDAGHMVSGSAIFSDNGVSFRAKWCEIAGGLTRDGKNYPGCLLKSSAANFNRNHARNNLVHDADFRGGPSCVEAFPDCDSELQRQDDATGNPNPFAGCSTAVDECATRSGECHASASCEDPDTMTTNTVAELCECDDGFTGNGAACADINECDTDICGQGAACVNLPGSHRCDTCGPGFAPSGDQCVNVDECSDGTNTCGSNAQCMDTEGSYECECDSGYEMGSGGTAQNPMCMDIDECAPNNGKGPCAADATCTNAPTSGDAAICACPSNKPNGDGLAAGVGCLPDSPPLVAPSGNGLWPATVYALGDNVNSGPVSDLVDGYCNDAGHISHLIGVPDGSGGFVFGDWCRIAGGLTHNSESHAGCLLKASAADFNRNHDRNDRTSQSIAVDFRGGPSCAEAFPNCSDGEVSNLDGNGNPNPFAGCVSAVDECQTRAGECDANATCSDPLSQQGVVNTAEELCACNDGWTGDGTTCADINECMLETDNCHDDAVCTDTDGGFTCECKDGYSGDGVSSCDVIPDNECAPTNPCGDNTMCNDPTPTATSTGDYVCSCASGFSGTTTTGGPASCANINECDLQTDNCHADAVCTDTVGSFSCNCKDGFSGDGVSSCDAIPDDECNPNPCGANTVCRDPNPVATNTGDYVCSCGDGFSGTTTTGSPATCTDVDECVLGTDTCGDEEKCRNTTGSFECDGLPEVWIVAPAGEEFNAVPGTGCRIRKWTESCDGRDAALSDCTPDGEGLVTVGVVFDCGN